MSYYDDAIFSAAMTAMDFDLPIELLPLTITNQAALQSGVWD